MPSGTASLATPAEHARRRPGHFRRLRRLWVWHHTGQKPDPFRHVPQGAGRRRRNAYQSDRFTDRTSCILLAMAPARSSLRLPKGQRRRCIAGAEGSGQDLYPVHPLHSGQRYPIQVTTRSCRAAGTVFRWKYRHPYGGNVRRPSSKERADEEDIDWFIPHSANMRIIEAICQRVGSPLKSPWKASANWAKLLFLASIPLL